MSLASTDDMAITPVSLSIGNPSDINSYISWDKSVDGRPCAKNGLKALWRSQYKTSKTGVTVTVLENGACIEERFVEGKTVSVLRPFPDGYDGSHLISADGAMAIGINATQGPITNGTEYTWQDGEWKSAVGLNPNNESRSSRSSTNKKFGSAIDIILAAWRLMRLRGDKDDSGSASQGDSDLK